MLSAFNRGRAVSVAARRRAPRARSDKFWDAVVGYGQCLARTGVRRCSRSGDGPRMTLTSLKQLLVPSESMVVSGGRTWISVPNGLSFSN